MLWVQTINKVTHTHRPTSRHTEALKVFLEVVDFGIFRRLMQTDIELPCTSRSSPNISCAQSSFHVVNGIYTFAKDNTHIHP